MPGCDSNPVAGVTVGCTPRCWRIDKLKSRENIDAVVARQLLRATCRPRNGSTRAWRQTRAMVLYRDAYRCQLCRRAAAEVDHIVPVIDGGTDDPANLRSLCHDCHAAS